MPRSETALHVRILFCHLNHPFLCKRAISHIIWEWINYERSLSGRSFARISKYLRLDRECSIWRFKENKVELCNIYCYNENLQVIQAVQFLHELGSLQHFTTENLKSKVVVNPQWIVDVMACVVSVKNSPIKVCKDFRMIAKIFPSVGVISIFFF